MKEGIAVAGSILVDRLNEIAAYPSAGELTKISSVTKSIGGCVPNVAVDLKRVCPRLTVKAAGKVGDDEDGALVLSELSKSGVNVENVAVTSEKTSFTEVMSVCGGQRTFFTYAGASASFGADDVRLEDLNVRMLHLGYLLLLDEMDGGDGERLLERAKKLGIKTSVDLVSENSGRYSLVLPCLKHTDNLIINEHEAGKLASLEPTKENITAICERLKSLGVSERVIIHSAEYGACFDGENFTLVPSFELPRGFIKGSTGAGDAFCAAALFAIYENYGDRELLEFASAAAATALSEVDATSGVKSKAEIEAACKGLKRRKLC